MGKKIIGETISLQEIEDALVEILKTAQAEADKNEDNPKIDKSKPWIDGDTLEIPKKYKCIINSTDNPFNLGGWIFQQRQNNKKKLLEINSSIRILFNKFQIRLDNKQRTPSSKEIEDALVEVLATAQSEAEGNKNEDNPKIDKSKPWIDGDLLEIPANYIYEIDNVEKSINLGQWITTKRKENKKKPFEEDSTIRILFNKFKIRLENKQQRGILLTDIEAALKIILATAQSEAEGNKNEDNPKIDKSQPWINGDILEIPANYIYEIDDIEKSINLGQWVNDQRQNNRKKPFKEDSSIRILFNKFQIRLETQRREIPLKDIEAALEIILATAQSEAEGNKNKDNPKIDKSKPWIDGDILEIPTNYIYEIDDIEKSIDLGEWIHRQRYNNTKKPFKEDSPIRILFNKFQIRLDNKRKRVSLKEVEDALEIILANAQAEANINEDNPKIDKSQPWINGDILEIPANYIYEIDDIEKSIDLGQWVDNQRQNNRKKPFKEDSPIRILFNKFQIRLETQRREIPLKDIEAALEIILANAPAEANIGKKNSKIDKSQPWINGDILEIPTNYIYEIDDIEKSIDLGEWIRRQRYNNTQKPFKEDSPIRILFNKFKIRLENKKEQKSFSDNDKLVIKNYLNDPENKEKTPIIKYKELVVKLKRQYSTISTHITRNGGVDNYSPKYKTSRTENIDMISNNADNPNELDNLLNSFALDGMLLDNISLHNSVDNIQFTDLNPSTSKESLLPNDTDGNFLDTDDIVRTEDEFNVDDYVVNDSVNVDVDMVNKFSSSNNKRAREFNSSNTSLDIDTNNSKDNNFDLGDNKRFRR